MSTRYVYTYFMADNPARIEQVAPRHTEHWQGLRLEAYRGGPFGATDLGIGDRLAEICR